MEPIYTPHNVNPAYQLNWGLTVFWRQLPVPESDWFAQLQSVTEPDGVRVLKHRTTTANASQFFVSTKPHVSPAQIIRSVKGRLQYLVRDQQPKAFQRNYAIRSIGAATRGVVESYVSKQTNHHVMADRRVQQQFERYQRAYPAVDLSTPMFSAHGEYWYNLHLVFVNEHRWCEVREEILNSLLLMVERAALKHGQRLSRVALLADHIHLTLGCEVRQSPEDVAISYLNNCAFAYGQKPVFSFGYYAGTMGEYDRGAV